MPPTTRRHLVCFGDSITMNGKTPPDGWTWRLQRALDAERPERWLVHNAGVGSNTTAMALDRYVADVRPWLPGVALIQFGINDGYIFTHTRNARVSVGEFERNLREIVRLVQSDGGQVVLIVNHTMTPEGGHAQGNGQTVEANTQPYSQATRALGAAVGLPVIDLPERMAAAGVVLGDVLRGDGVHLSPAGQHVYGQLVLAGLREAKVLDQTPAVESSR